MMAAECKVIQIEHRVFAIQAPESAAVRGVDEIYSQGVPEGYEIVTRWVLCSRV